MKKLTLLFISLLVSIAGFSETKEVTIDKIKYLCDVETKTAKVLKSIKVTDDGDWSHPDPIYDYTVTSVIIPASITVDGEEYSVIEIEQGFLQWHDYLQSVTIPASIRKINGIARECPQLSTIIVDPDNQYYDSRENCNALIETKTNTMLHATNNSFIPESITKIGEEAFLLCDLMEEITIPENVSNIGEWAFSLGSDYRRWKPDGEKGTKYKLTKVYSKIKNPFPISKNTFVEYQGDPNLDPGPDYMDSWHPLDITLYVPKGTKEKYQTTEGWKRLTNIVEDETLGEVSSSDEDKLNYSENADNTITVVSSESTETEVEIPEQVNGKDVSEIGANAFVGKTNVTDIYLPETDEALTLGSNALKIDDDHVATVHVPLSLLVDYALNEELKQNFEAGKVVATITAPNQYWTFSSGVDVLVPDGVKVYICKAINGSDIQIVELTDAELTVDGKKVIKANNGVLISSTSGNAYDLVAKSGAQASGTIPAAFENANSYEGNKLVPVVRSQNYDPDQYYMLYNGGFIKIADGDVTKTPACRALLKK